MTRQIVCVICGRTFTTERTNKKYCSFSCKEAAHIMKRKEWELKNPSYNAEYQKKLRAKQRTEKQKHLEEH